MQEYQLHTGMWNRVNENVHVYFFANDNNCFQNDMPEADDGRPAAQTDPIHGAAANEEHECDEAMVNTSNALLNLTLLIMKYFAYYTDVCYSDM